MVPSITEWLNELLTHGVTTLLCTLISNPQTAAPEIVFRGTIDGTPALPPQRFAAYNDQLLPLDGLQTFSEAVMRSGMTDAQKVEWLYITCQEYEQKYPLGLEQHSGAAQQKEA